MGSSLSVVPFEPDPGGSVLVVGAGGGFDFFCGLPILLELEERGYAVHLASYSFTDLPLVRNAERPHESIVRVTAASTLEKGDYFPEQHVASWFRGEHGAERPVWCFPKVGVQPLLSAYDFLIEQLGVATVVCVDGGVDGVFRGDECDLGTPSMDAISVVATSACKAQQRVYACTAFGVEGAEAGVSHAQALRRFADLAGEGGWIGVGALTRRTEVGRRFLRTVDEVFAGIEPVRRSVVVSALRASILGEFGHRSVHVKTDERPLWISPLTSLIWYFDAECVARMKLFHEAIRTTRTVAEAAEAIESVRGRVAIQPHEPIPL